MPFRFLEAIAAAGLIDKLTCPNFLVFFATPMAPVRENACYSLPGEGLFGGEARPCDALVVCCDNSTRIGADGLIVFVSLRGQKKVGASDISATTTKGGGGLAHGPHESAGPPPTVCRLSRRVFQGA